MKKLLKIFVFLFAGFSLQSQELLPFVENFTKSEYNGDNQNWSVAQGNDNALYFANNHYFLRYNGVKWEKYTLPNKTVIRSVFIDGDKVYCGSYKEFGYWKRIEGKMKYFSLSENRNLFYGNSENEEIWKVFKLGDKIYFQSFNEIFIYGNNQIEKIRFPFLISYCYVVDNQIYVASVRRGIYRMEGRKFIKIENWSSIDNNVFHNIEKNDGRTYIFTKTNGIYIDQGGKLSAWQNPLNERLKKEVIVAARFINRTKLAIGTGLQGLYIVDLQNNTFKNFNRENAIKNNAVLSILVDKESDVWLGLDNGIAHVEINSPVNVFSDNSGILGSVYGLSTFNSGYLFVTNHGVFSYKDKKLWSIPDSQGQVWNITKLNNEYLIGHNDGTFLYDGVQFKKVNNVNGGWNFLKSRYDNAYFQPNYSGIVVYTNSDFSKGKPLAGITKPIRNIAQNKPNELWGADNYRGLYRITYDNNFNTKKIENVSQSNGIKNDYNVKIFSYKDEILFLIDKIWYTYNSISGKLEKDRVFNSAFPNISDIIPVDDENFIVLNSGLLYVISQKGNEFSWEVIPEKYYEGKLIFENSRAYKTGNTILLNLDDGFISYELKRNSGKVHKIDVEAFYQGNLITDATNVEYNQTVEINVVPIYYGYNRQNLFYRLNDSRNFTLINKGNLILNNLHSGRQEIGFYYFDGKRYVKISDYTFWVDYPWYFSFWMILVYLLLISGIFFLYYRWNKFRYIQKLELQEEELKHEKKILEIELKTENEKRLQEYEKHILELEVQTKSSEVAGKSLSIAKQTELIESIEKILDNENDIGQIKNKIRKSIKSNAINKNEWQSFEKNLMKSNDEFVQKLSKKFPSLTSKDIKLAIYLKMNMSSKEIAPLMNISFRGVELHRYRLRKKLGLASDESLSKFMITI